MARALVVQPDSKLGAVGSIITGEEVSAGISFVFDFALARYLNTSAALAVTIDIKPGIFPNTITPKSHWVIPIAILTTDTVDPPVDPHERPLRPQRGAGGTQQGAY